MGKSVANPWNAGSFNPDPSPKYGLSARFFMLSKSIVPFFRERDRDPICLVRDDDNVVGVAEFLEC